MFKQLTEALADASRLLRKYAHHGQAEVVEQIADSFVSGNPDYARLQGLDMWGGSGAVWETSLSPLRRTDETVADEGAFRQAIIEIASAMDRLGIGTERSRSTAEIFRDWIAKGL
jgi:hypothetical protein